MSKVQSWENFGHKCVPVIYKSKKRTGKLLGVSAAKDLIMLDPSRTKIESFPAISRTSRLREYFQDLLNAVTLVT